MIICRQKNYSLFKFDASYHAITMNSYLMEQGVKDLEELTENTAVGKLALFLFFVAVVMELTENKSFFFFNNNRQIQKCYIQQ